MFHCSQCIPVVCSRKPPSEPCNVPSSHQNYIWSYTPICSQWVFLPDGKSSIDPVSLSSRAWISSFTAWRHFSSFTVSKKWVGSTPAVTAARNFLCRRVNLSHQTQLAMGVTDSEWVVVPRRDQWGVWCDKHNPSSDCLPCEYQEDGYECQGCYFNIRTPLVINTPPSSSFREAEVEP